MSNTVRMGILVGGGPAPGINSAIGAAVWEWVRWQWHRSRRPGQDRLNRPGLSPAC